MSSVSVTIAILNYNGVSYLQKFLPSVIKNSKRYSIAVIDNGSTDDSVKVLQEEYPQVSLVRLEKNFGFCSGYNRGLKFLKADYYILLNSDVEVTEGWIEPIVEMMESDKKIAACQPKILSFSDRNKFEYAGASGGFIDWLGYPFCRGRIFQDLENDEGQYDDPMRIFWASGACFFVRAQLFHETGGFNDKFFAHMEEIDLSWRFQNRGYSIWCIPESKVYHLGGGTLNKNSPGKTYLNFRNNLGLLINNMPAGKLMIVIPIRIFLDLLAALSFLFGSGPGHFIAVVKAYLMVPTVIKRDKITGLPKLFRRSIIWKRYIEGKRKFSELKT